MKTADVGLWVVKIVVDRTTSGFTWWGDFGESDDLVMTLDAQVVLTSRWRDLRRWTIANLHRTNLGSRASSSTLLQLLSDGVSLRTEATFRLDRLSVLSETASLGEQLDALNLLWDLAKCLRLEQITQQMTGSAHPLGALVNALTVGDREEVRRLVVPAQPTVRSAVEQLASRWLVV